MSNQNNRGLGTVGKLVFASIGVGIVVALGDIAEAIRGLSEVIKWWAR